MRGKRRAFTLLEILLAVGILAILATLGLRQFEDYRRRARAAQCLANLRGIGNGLQIYAAENSGRLPALTADNVNLDGGGGAGGIDLRFVLIQYDSAYWGMVCPSDPRKKNDPHAGDPTYLSYIYLHSNGLDLGALTTPIRVARDSGYHHGRPGKLKSAILFSDQHLEMESW
ncbi:MAG: type II secretion system protein [Verrucomicrobiae bacterium]|nr:type II secretion system protein [Verrucomicrobiae bacterium]